MKSNQTILFQATRPIDSNTTAKQTVRNRQKHINTQKSQTNLFAHDTKMFNSFIGTTTPRPVEHKRNVVKNSVKTW